jgi:hypothetical protein
MCTSIMLATLLGLGAAPASQTGETPSWQENYTTAREVGRRQKKPLAVIIGRGPRGWEKISEEGEPTPSVRKLLARNYVCVYVDAGSEPGKRLADAFSMAQGLVISSRDGEVQAYRHSGRLSSGDLEATLRLHANDSGTAQAKSVGQPRVSYSYDPVSPRPAPVAYPANFGGFGGSGGFGSFGGFGGSGGGSC